MILGWWEPETKLPIEKSVANFKNVASWNTKNKDLKERVKKVYVLKLNLILFFVKKPYKQRWTETGNLDIYVQSNIIHNGQRWKQPTCLSFSGWMSEQMCYIYTYTMDIILFSLKKEWAGGGETGSC